MLTALAAWQRYKTVTSSTFLHLLSEAKGDEKEKRWEWANKRKQKGDQEEMGCWRHVEWQRSRREGEAYKVQQ